MLQLPLNENGCLDLGMKKVNEAVHLCPICHVVEMEFVERVESEKHFRIRRFKCPVCDHKEMYTCGGPDDKRRQQESKDKTMYNKLRKKRIKDESFD